MKSSIFSIGLLLLLVGATAALGVVLAGGGGLGGHTSGGPNSNEAATTRTVVPPLLLVKASTVATVVADSGSGNRTFPFLEPMPGVKFVVQGLGNPSGAIRGPVFSYSLVTNSSGMGEVNVPQGNFSVTAVGPDFSYQGVLTFRANAITNLSVEVTPTYGAVKSLSVVNQDTVRGVESTGALYAYIAGDVNYSRNALSLLTGNAGPTPLSDALVSIKALVIGYYSTPGGTIVVLQPSSAYPTLPTSNVSLLQYRTNSTVNYIAD